MEREPGRLPEDRRPLKPGNIVKDLTNCKPDREFEVTAVRRNADYVYIRWVAYRAGGRGHSRKKKISELEFLRDR